MAAFYHGNIKHLIVAFNAYFANIHVVRRKGDSVDGEPIQDLRIPIAFSNRAKWMAQILEGTRDKQVKITLPRMAFEITGFTYDASRKKTRNQQVKCVDENGNLLTVGNPVPWNVELALYIVADNQEDALQIVEQILPQFNPDMNITFKNVIGINTTVPISLSGVSFQDDYEGSFNDDRLVVYTLTFTAKLDLYGEVMDHGNFDSPIMSENNDADVAYDSELNGYEMNNTFMNGRLLVRFNPEPEARKDKNKSPEITINDEPTLNE
jgi:hypothetical protein